MNTSSDDYSHSDTSPSPLFGLIRETALATRKVLTARAPDLYESWNGGCCRQISLMCREALMRQGIECSIKLATLSYPHQDPIEHAVISIGSILIDGTTDPPGILDPNLPHVAGVTDMPPCEPHTLEFFTKMTYREFTDLVFAAMPSTTGYEADADARRDTRAPN